MLKVTSYQRPLWKRCKTHNLRNYKNENGKDMFQINVRILFQKQYFTLKLCACNSANNVCERVRSLLHIFNRYVVTRQCNVFNYTVDLDNLFKPGKWDCQALFVIFYIEMTYSVIVQSDAMLLHTRWLWCADSSN